MITYISDIMMRNVATVNATDSLHKAQLIMLREDIDSLPVVENGKLIGLLTSSDIMKTNPNRIVIDAMTDSFISIAPDTTIIYAIEMLKNTGIRTLLVIDKNKLVGIVTSTLLYIEFGKYIDALTGLYRSQYIYQKGEELIRKGRQLSIIFIDINKFGEVDKDYGHIFGDAVLKELGALLKARIPDEVYLCRYGGDEFVLLTACSIDKCEAVAGDVLRAISLHNFDNGIKITACAGVAGGGSIDEKVVNPVKVVSNLINLASLASTKAKREKKHIVTVCDVDITEIA